MIRFIRNLFEMKPSRPSFTVVGRDFNGHDVGVDLPIPDHAGPGYYEFEYIQDCGGGAMVCGPVIRAESYEDAVRNGADYVCKQGFACQFAYGNQPERVRRLPEELQSLTLEEAKRCWKEHPLYNAELAPNERINPWVFGPVRSARAGW